MKLPLAVALSLALAGCEQRQWTHDEILDIASDAADTGAVEEVASRVSDLESENAELKAEVSSLQSELSATESRLSDLEARTPY